MQKIGAERMEDIPVWKGLMCVHAQEQVRKTWAKFGFEVDEGMGTWTEEGIKHVGMFRRVGIMEKGAGSAPFGGVKIA